ncbi:MAG: hypothetical protein VX772_04015, partial [Bacteroidota bacterium]|nr:hypothetical protein [Bacteroidota bacterium]
TVLISALFVFALSCDNTKSSLTLFSDQIPMDAPLVFGQGLVSIEDAMDFAITFNPEMDEMYFTRRFPGGRNNIFVSKLIDNSWTTPELASFSSEDTWEFEPHVDPTGGRLYFGSTRPINDSVQSPGLIQWYCEKSENGWSAPVPMQHPVVSTYMMYLTSSKNGNLYFTSQEEGANIEEGGIYYSYLEEGKYNEIKRMGEEINQGKMIAHSFIAPDESYMIFDGKKSSGFGDSDLYISFNTNDSWTKAVNLGSKINTEQTEMAPSVSPDGKYLFFHRGYEVDSEGEDGSEWFGNIYWVDFSSVLENIKELDQ